MKRRVGKMEIKIVRDVLEKNKELAVQVRARLRKKNRTMFNLMGSPGCGKTALLEKLIPMLKSDELRIGVIEGDVATLNDSLRLQELDVPIAHISTERFGSTCHLGANVVLGALELLEDENMDLVFIENVGNLICPAEYDTGAGGNIVVISVTEGEDKPLKYPQIFHKTEVAIINKIDLVEPVGADLNLLKENIRKVNPSSKIFEISARSGENMEPLREWLQERHGELLIDRK